MGAVGWQSISERWGQERTHSGTRDFGHTVKVCDPKCQWGYKVTRSHDCIGSSLYLQWLFSYPKIKIRDLTRPSALRRLPGQRTFSWDDHTLTVLTDIQLHTCTYQTVGQHWRGTHMWLLPSGWSQTKPIPANTGETVISVYFPWILTSLEALAWDIP